MCSESLESGILTRSGGMLALPVPLSEPSLHCYSQERALARQAYTPQALEPTGARHTVQQRAMETLRSAGPRPQCARLFAGDGF